MGKIRVKTIGVEEVEDKEKKKIKERNEAKKAEAAKRLAEKNAASNATAAEGNVIASEAKQSPTEEIAASQAPRNDEENSEKKTEKKVKKSKFTKQPKKNPHSSAYMATAKLIDINKKYGVTEAIQILSKEKRVKFDETIELHINTLEKGVSGAVTLPHGTGRETKIEIADITDNPKNVEEIVKKVSAGTIDFDILIATPDTMSHLAKIARFLGPRGLMPNPKNGTIHPKPKEAMKKFQGGQINFKTEPKFPIIHLSVGKLSFEEKKLTENIKTVIQAVKAANIKSITLKSTMSPGIKITI